MTQLRMRLAQQQQQQQHLPFAQTLYLGPSRIIRRTMLMVAAPRRLCASVPSASSCPLQLLLLRAPASSLHFSAGPPLLLLALLICKVIVVGLLAWFFLFCSLLFNFHLLVSICSAKCVAIWLLFRLPCFIFGGKWGNR